MPKAKDVSESDREYFDSLDLTSNESRTKALKTASAPQLKSICRCLGLPVSGTKGVLLDCLFSHFNGSLEEPPLGNFVPLFFPSDVAPPSPIATTSNDGDENTESVNPMATSNMDVSGVGFEVTSSSASNDITFVEMKIQIRYRLSSKRSFGPKDSVEQDGRRTGSSKA